MFDTDTWDKTELPESGNTEVLEDPKTNEPIENKEDKLEENKKSNTSTTQFNNDETTDIFDVLSWGNLHDSCAITFTHSHALLYCENRYELMILKDNPFQEKVGLNEFSGL